MDIINLKLTLGIRSYIVLQSKRENSNHQCMYTQGVVRGGQGWTSPSGV